MPASKHPKETWEQAKVLFARGVTVAEICEQLGTPFEATRKRAAREKWSVIRKMSEQVIAAQPITGQSLSREMSQGVQEVARKWQKSIAKLAEKHVAQLAEMPQPTEFEEFGQAEAALKSHVSWAKSALGLDTPGASTFNVGLRLDVNVLPVDLHDAEPITVESERVTPIPEN